MRSRRNAIAVAGTAVAVQNTENSRDEKAPEAGQGNRMWI
jgi:hypothetical protein